MPYVVKKKRGPKPFQIINQRTGEVVGTSDSLDKANRSIGYRIEAEVGPKKKQKKTKG